MASPQFNILNKSTDGNNLNLAFYQKVSSRDVEQIVAWRVIAPKIGVPTYMPALNNYAIFVKYKLNLVSYQTKPVAITQGRGTYNVTRQKDKVNLVLISPDQPENMVQVTNLPEVAVSVESCITLGANLVFPPMFLPPTTRGVIRMDTRFYTALVPASVTMGTIMTPEEVAPTQVWIRAGQTIYINGSAADGYSLSVENP